MCFTHVPSLTNSPLGVHFKLYLQLRPTLKNSTMVLLKLFQKAEEEGLLPNSLYIKKILLEYS